LETLNAAADSVNKLENELQVSLLRVQFPDCLLPNLCQNIIFHLTLRT